MSKEILTPAAETKTANVPARGSASMFKGKLTKTEASKVIPQNSKQAEKLLAASKAKASAEKGNPVTKVTKPETVKASKAKKVTMASKLDEVILTGGKWDALVTKAEAESKKLGGHIKYNAGVIKAHIKFRTVTQKKADYLGKLKVTEEGILEAKAKAKKAA